MIRRIVLAALEHLHIAGDAKAMEVYCNAGRGLAVVIAWEHSLPPLEQAALRQYVVGKITYVTGLSYGRLDVFFDPSGLLDAQALSDKHVSSSWLRERIRSLTSPAQKPSRSGRNSRASAGSTIAAPDLSAEETTLGLGSENPSKEIFVLRQMFQMRRAGSLDAWAPTVPPPTDGFSGAPIIDGFLTVHADLDGNHSQSR